MHLTPREIDKLLFFAGELARSAARGLKLNIPKLSRSSLGNPEMIRDGRSVAEIMSLGATILTPTPSWRACPR